jgi:IS30 family transposase
MLSYTHFTLNEREYLQELFEKGYSIRKIASILGRSPSSVSREIKRNRSKKRYHAWRAQVLTIERRRKCERRRLKAQTPEWDYIVAHLKKFWTPEEICGRWNLEHPDAPRLHFSTIYRYIKRKEFPDISAKNISEGEENASYRAIPTITASSRIGSSPNGRRRSGYAPELATGRAIPYTAALEKACW